MNKRLLFAVVVVAILLSISSAFCANGGAKVSASPPIAMLNSSVYPSQPVTAGTVSIKGTVKDAAGKAISGVTVATSDGAATSITSSDGSYLLTVPYGWVGRITLDKPFFRFSPSMREYTVEVCGDVTGQDYLATPPLSLAKTFNAGTASSFAWGDYDKDGWMDIAFLGNVYHNDGGSLNNAFALRYNFATGLAWGDYDNDGDLDLIDSYQIGSQWPTIRTDIMRNDGTSLVFAGGVTTGDPYNKIAWVDYNNDGRLDFSALAINTPIRIFRNDGGGTFTWVNQVVTSSNSNCSMSWADYDNDGDMDLALAGSPRTKIYRNNGDGTFTDINANLPDSSGGTVIWVDYDNDGDFDLSATGRYATGDSLKVFRNDNGVFTDIQAGLMGTTTGWYEFATIAWGDLDNDGDLDCVSTQYVNNNEKHCWLYRNDNGAFSKVDVGYIDSPISLADFDGDGDLDIIGGDKLYTNNFNEPNTVPLAPTGLWSKRVGNTFTFGWLPATDAETPTSGLSYNLRVGTTPGGCDLFSGMATASGKRLIPAIGNAQKRLSWSLKGLPVGPIYWSVQAIDTAFAGSPWATERLGTVVEDIKCQTNGAVVSCGRVVVTAVFDNSFYVEEPTRASGIRVDKAGHGMTVRRSVDISGTVETDQTTGERYISASTVTDRGTGAVAPITLAIRNLGGGQLGLQDAVWSRVWTKIPGDGLDHKWLPALGLNNIGLYVQVFGKVTQIEPDGQYFYIDDGSRLLDDTKTGEDANIGIRVSGDGRSYTKGQFLTLTGISSCFKGADGSLLRLVRPIEIR